MRNGKNGFMSALGELCGRPSIKIDFSMTTTKGTESPGSTKITHNSEAETSLISLSYANGIDEELFVRWNDRRESFWWRRITNTTKKMIHLVEASFTLSRLKMGKNHKEDFFYHAENPRIYGRYTIPVRLKRTAAMVEDSGFDSLAGNKWADPGVVCDRVGASPYQPFPAVLLGNYQTDMGLVHGSLSQRVFYHNHLFTHKDDSVTWEMLSSLKAVSHRNLAPGEIIDNDEWYLGMADSRDYERIFDGYTAALRRALPASWGRSPINRHTASWGSWNDGIWRDIDEKRLLRMADFLRENFPTVEWMQIDDGYATNAGKLKIAHGLGSPYEGEDAFDAKKFPNGLKHFTDQVRQRGIRPAIWVGGWVPSEAPLAKDHPDWFVDYSYRVKTAKVLDISKPEVREYMRKALDVLLTESGFEGMKHDFWSYVFEDSHALLERHDKSGYEWRTWWLREVRRRLSTTGYLQTGCDIVMGNPFLGEYFNNYRYGIDVGGGEWEHLKTNFLWGAACFATHTGDLLVPNSDAICLFADMPDNEVLTWINYCIISRSLVEVAGWLYQHPAHPRMRWLRKAMACLNNGQDVHFAKFDYREAAAGETPAIWHLDTPYFSKIAGNPCVPVKTVAVFNLDDKPQRFSLRSKDLGLTGTDKDYVATNVWTSETVPLSQIARLSLAAHESHLFTINTVASQPQILDANLEITHASHEGKKLSVTFRHGGQLELTLSIKPKSVLFDGKMETVSVKKGKGNWMVEAPLKTPGTMRIRT